MNTSDLNPMTENDFRDKGIPVSTVFIRASKESKGTRPENRKYVSMYDSTGIALTMREISNLVGTAYDYIVLHDSIDGCMVLNVKEFKYAKIPCKVHGFDR